MTRTQLLTLLSVLLGVFALSEGNRRGHCQEFCPAIVDPVCAVESGKPDGERPFDNDCLRRQYNCLNNVPAARPMGGGNDGQERGQPCALSFARPGNRRCGASIILRLKLKAGIFRCKPTLVDDAEQWFAVCSQILLIFDQHAQIIRDFKRVREIGHGGMGQNTLREPVDTGVDVDLEALTT
ncbi:uncharacterized protein LOC113214378 isoform X2 [Frankliniella occidentalis]|uniref:Uncharacterized protein LOC113214378 isoform X2 n=1 Tax=Frankliniella occidentalis TaxID=133901 RepID=A0A6J1T7D1_FRAOC|nr:uncharacterized protein LOC113214378 isoform X2 [Frankliniella occidentalis]